MYMENNIKEMYVSRKDVLKYRYVLCIMYDGSVTLSWYMGDMKVDEKEPTLCRRYDGSMKIEYGEKNLLGVRQTMCFSDANGKLEKEWEKIK